MYFVVHLFDIQEVGLSKTWTKKPSGNFQNNNQQGFLRSTLFIECGPHIPPTASGS